MYFCETTVCIDILLRLTVCISSSFAHIAMSGTLYYSKQYQGKIMQTLGVIYDFKSNLKCLFSSASRQQENTQSTP